MSDQLLELKRVVKANIPTPILTSPIPWLINLFTLRPLGKMKPDEFHVKYHDVYVETSLGFVDRQLEIELEEPIKIKKETYNTASWDPDTEKALVLYKNKLPLAALFYEQIDGVAHVKQIQSTLWMRKDPVTTKGGNMTYDIKVNGSNPYIANIDWVKILLISLEILCIQQRISNRIEVIHHTSIGWFHNPVGKINKKQFRRIYELAPKELGYTLDPKLGSSVKELQEFYNP